MIEERIFLIYVKNNRDWSEYNLVCDLNGKEIKKEVNYSLEDCCMSLGSFVNSIIEEYELDIRYDELRVKIDMRIC